MTICQCMLTKNDCYKLGVPMIPKGVMVHSTGANNPYLKRYVQPTNKGDAPELGYNKYENDWNHAGLNVCVHGFIGKQADGAVAVYQTLPWDTKGWHSYYGKNGSANDTHISFEICEDDLTDETYFNKVYRSAVQLTAHLCNLYHLDPMQDGVVIDHSEGYKRGLASNHGDVKHWFTRFGKTMDDFRRAVAEEMHPTNGTTETEENDLTVAEVQKIVDDAFEKHYATELKEIPEWAQPTIAKLKAKGYLQGTSVADLHLSTDMLRMFVVNDRAGLYGKEV